VCCISRNCGKDEVDVARIRWCTVRVESKSSVQPSVRIQRPNTYLRVLAFGRLAVVHDVLFPLVVCLLQALVMARL
jgi:hypothetical protein